MDTQRGNQRSDLGAAHSAESVHVWDYIRALYKRRWVAIPIFLIGFTVGAVNTFLEVPVYDGRTQLLIESDTQRVAKIDQMFQGDSNYFDDEFRQTQLRILQSRSLARRTIDALKLWDAPKLGEGPEPKSNLSVTGLVFGAVNTAIALAKKPFEAQTPTATATTAEARTDETARQSARIDQFLGGLNVLPIRNSRMVEIHYSSTDPVFAAKAANAVAKAYMDQNMEFRFNTSKDAADFLGDRLAEQRRAVEASEASLQAFKEKHGAVSVADTASNIVVQRLTDLNAALTKAKTERINKEALYNQLKAAEGTGALDTYPAVLTNDYIQKLKVDLTDLQRQQAQLAERYGPKNVEMIKIKTALDTADARLRGELAKVVESVKNEYETAYGEERSLQSALDAQKNEALSQNRTGIEYGVLQRESESNRQIYESLLQRTKESGISSELRASNVRVVDEAEIPRRPISPDVQRELTISLAGSLLLAVGLAFGLEYLDNRIKTPEQIRNQLGLPFLGMVPVITSKDMHGEAPLLNNGVPASFAEALKSIRTSLLFSSAAEGAKSLVITSTGPGEGKTLISSNVAIALAQAGQRVILIDADMRRPRIHEMFLCGQEPGLSNLIVEKSPEKDVIHKTSVPGLSVMAAGHVPPNPSELLGSRRFKEIIADLRERFDWVVIDSPPVMAVTDACLIAHDATGVLFVVGAEMTNRNTATVALDQLESSHARFVGAVLNRVNVNRHGYYYSHYYRRDYSEHYGKPAQAEQVSTSTSLNGR